MNCWRCGITTSSLNAVIDSNEVKRMVCNVCYRHYKDTNLVGEGIQPRKIDKEDSFKRRTHR